ncbi:GTPase HflX [Lactobacillus sp. CC-MHH1034]|uniref:GTPase HflX n=1 Tax=Agrilactobacillus fermenti TaxID=2586909 RepID=UPI001E65A2FE|nr:GTPase HflX [Agrilactobacillus fermenti]MCD2256093.1 GTPase HflX [Agrilactobacillus fermenti]
MTETQQPNLRVLLGGVNVNDPEFDYTMTELGQLAEANNFDIVGQITQNSDRLQAATYFGSGKVHEIKATAEAQDAKALVVNDELSPSQIRNLEKQTKLYVIDRTQLILRIFADRAQTKMAKTQVEIARLKYELPRIHPSSNPLDQQGGASGLANRGAGESQLELDRRVLQKRITRLQQTLAQILKDQATQSKERQRSLLPKVALVGYTNAGKSTVMNQLLKHYAANEPQKQVFQKNMLFATLDTSVRQIDLPNQQSFLLSDTVGFVSKLPHNLVESFRATLAEAKNADLLIHVVDYANPHFREMMAVTDQVLKELGITDIPVIEVYNKADLTDIDYPMVNGNEVYLSAQDEKSIETLSSVIQRQLFAKNPVVDMLIPFTQGQLTEYLMTHARIINQDYTEHGTKLKVQISPKLLGRFEKYRA